MFNIYYIYFEINLHKKIISEVYMTILFSGGKGVLSISPGYAPSVDDEGLRMPGSQIQLINQRTPQLGLK